MVELELVADRHSGGPLYRQIADQLAEQIRSGGLTPGTRLPTIRALASNLGVNRDTVSLAYESLASDGLIDSRVGRGTFVRLQPVALVPARPESLGAPSRPPRIDLAPRVDRLLAFENSRPHVPAASGADIVPLHSLIPDPATYPADEFRRCINRVLIEEGASVLLYGAPQGHEGLRACMADRFRARGMQVGADEIVLCHGASQGISLATRLFAEPGDAIAVEVPTYHNIIATLIGSGLGIVPVPMSEQGPDLDALDQALARPDVKAFYTIPSFHNPMGITTDIERRQAVLAIAARHGVPVLEDAFEMDLRFQGREVAPLAALDSDGWVVHLFSFSKSLFPGVRVGSVTARGRALDALVALKHSTDLSDSLPLQAALAAFVGAGAYDRHLVRIRRLLRERHAAAAEALAAEMPEGTRFTSPSGGYQIWVELPFDLDTRDLLEEAAREGVRFSPGAQFDPEQGPSPALRLTVAQADVDAIRRGIAALGRAIRTRAGRAPVARRLASVNL